MLAMAQPNLGHYLEYRRKHVLRSLGFTMMMAFIELIILAVLVAVVVIALRPPRR